MAKALDYEASLLTPAANTYGNKGTNAFFFYFNIHVLTTMFKIYNH